MPRQRASRRRWWWSWTALVAAVLVLCGAGVAGLRMVQQQSEQRVLDQVLDEARVVDDLVVRRNLDDADLRGSAPEPAGRRADMQGDVSMLHGTGRVVGLEVWHADGAPLFTDSGHAPEELRLPEQERLRAQSGTPWVARSAADVRGQSTVDVFLPHRDRSGTVVGLVELLFPDQDLTAAIGRETRDVELVGVSLLLLVAAGLVVLRRRLLRREHQARHDPLTGLLNRAALAEDGQALLAAATDAHPAGFLVLDLDGFKSVNDTLGHAAGDLLLVQVADALRAAVRPGDLVVRLGGDEFAVLLRELPADRAGQEAVAQQLLHRLRAGSFQVHGVALAVDASIGVALAPGHGCTVDGLLQRGDVAMYQAKRARCGSAVYDPDTDQHDVGQLAVLVELRRAVERDELVLHYQPQVRLDDDAVVGVEALVRWQHPERGLLPPDSFVPLAESTGLMAPLTEWVLRAAVRQAASWQRAGQPLRVAVNISPRSLLEGDLPALVLDVLAGSGLPAALLELEITETAVMTDPERAGQVLRHLAAMGVKVSIDDFGAGYTSLAYLRTLPVKALKIDRALVSGMLEGPGDGVIAEAVIGLGHRLGLAVLAEGVETAAVYQRLRDLSCDEVQGYLLTRPLPPDALEGWLASWQGTAGAATTCPATATTGSR